MKIALEERAHELTTPLAAAHGVVSVRNLLIIRSEDDEGNTGWGEASPVAGYSGAGIDDCRSALEAVRESAAAADPDDPDALLAAVEAILPPPARAGLECSLRDLAARRAGIRLLDAFGGSAVEKVPLRALLPSQSASDLRREAEAAVTAGFSSFKIKLGSSRELDRQRIRIARESAGEAGHLCGDANGGWTFDEATTRIGSLEPGTLDLIEQPVVGRSDLARLRGPSVQLALDEAATETGALDSPPCADAVCIKVQAWGGIDRALTAASEARAAGFAVYFGSSLEGAVGTAASLIAAQAFGPDLASGVDTLDLFEWQFPAFPDRQASRAAPEGPGLGIDPDGTRL